MALKCTNCNLSFQPNLDQLKFIHESRQKAMTFMMLSCPNCGLGFAFNPSENTEISNERVEHVWRSPISGSHGHISFVEDAEGDFYGCSETGAIWYERESLFRDIDQIIEKYPHRKSFYLKVNDEWLPNENLPENADDLIDSEEQEEIDDYIRD